MYSEEHITVQRHTYLAVEQRGSASAQQQRRQACELEHRKQRESQYHNKKANPDVRQSPGSIGGRVIARVPDWEREGSLPLSSPKVTILEPDY